MPDKRKSRFAGPVLGTVLSVAVALVMVHFAHWFDHLTSSELFLVVFGAVAIIWFGTERFYRWEYSRDYVSDSHLRGLRQTAQRISINIPAKELSILHNLGKDCDALFSHDHKIRKEVRWWDSEVSAWTQAGWDFNKELAAALDENGLNNYPFNREGLLQLIRGLCRDREMKFQLFDAPRQTMQWQWTTSEVVTPSGRKNAIILGDENGTSFIWDIDDPQHPVNAGDCERRLISIFESADNSPTLQDWVRREITLMHDNRVESLKELLHDFMLNDRLRTGRGCRRCNS